MFAPHGGALITVHDECTWCAWCVMLVTRPRAPALHGPTSLLPPALLPFPPTAASDRAARPRLSAYQPPAVPAHLCSSSRGGINGNVPTGL